MQDYTNFTDEHLLHRLQQSDEKAFTEIYNRHWEKMVATGLYFTHSNAAAEDIVHEVMMSLWLRKTELSITSLSAYLGTAVKFAVFKSIAREKRRRDLIAGHSSINENENIEEKLDARFIEDILHKKTEELPEKARLVFQYSRKNEMTIAEIATKLDLSPKAVEYHMTKALRLLRETLKKIKCFFV